MEEDADSILLLLDMGQPVAGNCRSGAGQGCTLVAGDGAESWKQRVN